MCLFFLRVALFVFCIPVFISCLFFFVLFRSCFVLIYFLYFSLGGGGAKNIDQVPNMLLTTVWGVGGEGWCTSYININSRKVEGTAYNNG